MKQFFCLLTVIAVYTKAAAQLQHTRWKSTLQINGSDMNVLIDFGKDTALLYTVADSNMIERMTYKQTDTTFTLTKIDGESGCGGEPGQYRYNVKNGRLTMKLIQDDCYDRYSLIQNTEWAPYKTYAGIQLPPTVLKQYTGVYALDDAHPITISLESGILYAEGPNNGLPKSALTPVTESSFFLKIAGVLMDFVKDEKGNVVKLISHEQKDYELKKIK